MEYGGPDESFRYRSPRKKHNADVLVLKTFPWRENDLLNDLPFVYKGVEYTRYTNQSPKEQRRLYRFVRSHKPQIEEEKKAKKAAEWKVEWIRNEPVLIRFSN